MDLFITDSDIGNRESICRYSMLYRIAWIFNCCRESMEIAVGLLQK